LIKKKGKFSALEHITSYAVVVKLLLFYLLPSKVVTISKKLLYYKFYSVFLNNSQVSN